MLDYPISIYKFRDNIPEIQGQYPGTASLESCRNSMPKESQTWINLKNQISKINKVLKQVSSRKLKNQISKFNKVLKQSVKCQAEELKNQISKVKKVSKYQQSIKVSKYQSINKVSKQSVKANFPSLIWWTASTLKWWGRNHSILKSDWNCH